MLAASPEQVAQPLSQHGSASTVVHVWPPRQPMAPSVQSVSSKQPGVKAVAPHPGTSQRQLTSPSDWHADGVVKDEHGQGKVMQSKHAHVPLTHDTCSCRP
jgi:hypothetical protein